jgi:actin-like ATPase involved in cell morphogenesis
MNRTHQGKSVKRRGRTHAEKKKHNVNVPQTAPAFSKVLSDIADTLRANGAQIAPRVLDVLSAAMTFLGATGNMTDSDMVAASHLAAQLRSDDASKVAAALGLRLN